MFRLCYNCFAKLYDRGKVIMNKEEKNKLLEEFRELSELERNAFLFKFGMDSVVELFVVDHECEESMPEVEGELSQAYKILRDHAVSTIVEEYEEKLEGADAIVSEYLNDIDGQDK